MFFLSPVDSGPEGGWFGGGIDSSLEGDMKNEREGVRMMRDERAEVGEGGRGRDGGGSRVEKQRIESVGGRSRKEDSRRADA